MRHLAIAGLLLALSACKVERTPRTFYTERDPGVVEQQDAVGEIRDRVRNFAEHLGRGQRAEAVEAMAAEDLAQVIGGDGNRGMTRMGPGGLALALDSLVLPTPAVARTPDLVVRVGLREGMGWFSTHVELIPVGAPARPPARIRATGVFTRDRGGWRLTQIHLSQPAPPADPAGTDSARADSARADTAAADSASE